MPILSVRKVEQAFLFKVSYCKRVQPFARQAQLKYHMKTAWIRMRRRVTRRLTRFQAVDTQDNSFTNFE